MVMGEDRELDQGGLLDVSSILLGSSDYCPIVEANWYVVSEILLTSLKYQSFSLNIIIHFRME